MRKILILLCAISLFFAGCGDDSNDTSPSTGSAKTPLIIFIVDSSGSMIGFDDILGINFEQASDRGDERISFLKKIVSAVPDNSSISLVNLSDRASALVACGMDGRTSCEVPKTYCSTPTQDRQETECGLDALGAGEDGPTPLNGVLKRVLDGLVAQNDEHEPLVVLVTDGVEGDDPSGDVTAPGQAADLYQTANFGKPIPIVAVHFQVSPGSQYPKGRSSGLELLANKTGGTYVFLESSNDLKNTEVIKLVSSRIIDLIRL